MELVRCGVVPICLALLMASHAAAQVPDPSSTAPVPRGAERNGEPTGVARQRVPEATRTDPCRRFRDYVGHRRGWVYVAGHGYLRADQEAPDRC